ncbi:uncharacterized protein MYCFIDRAFT_179625 [Pseudocercospora fijiensis CIRAD86]|uniref:Uncharacterized protein n=1 Tax=Pseudocercospora fijiensis (strain CIRAD86) TaxID=383855 RepID=M3A1C8_PSEFD|nr:uncharacterized protein MYCFIDRAFT_179625 [Pseudocercospora fijiensis CIRAD86]EME78186.1 hypothetical protein MYCFIDRAFT_179625 [Pseudocercospora fijiensis CIRAD86]
MCLANFEVPRRRPIRVGFSVVLSRTKPKGAPTFVEFQHRELHNKNNMRPTLITFAATIAFALNVWATTSGSQCLCRDMGHCGNQGAYGCIQIEVVKLVKENAPVSSIATTSIILNILIAMMMLEAALSAVLLFSISLRYKKPLYSASVRNSNSAKQCIVKISNIIQRGGEAGFAILSPVGILYVFSQVAFPCPEFHDPFLGFQTPESLTAIGKKQLWLAFEIGRSSWPWRCDERGSVTLSGSFEARETAMFRFFTLVLVLVFDSKAQAQAQGVEKRQDSQLDRLGFCYGDGAICSIGNDLYSHISFRCNAYDNDIDKLNPWYKCLCTNGYVAVNEAQMSSPDVTVIPEMETRKAARVRAVLKAGSSFNATYTGPPPPGHATATPAHSTASVTGSGRSSLITTTDATASTARRRLKLSAEALAIGDQLWWSSCEVQAGRTSVASAAVFVRMLVVSIRYQPLQLFAHPSLSVYFIRATMRWCRNSARRVKLRTRVHPTEYGQRQDHELPRAYSRVNLGDSESSDEYENAEHGSGKFALSVVSIQSPRYHITCPFFAPQAKESNIHSPKAQVIARHTPGHRDNGISRTSSYHGSFILLSSSLAPTTRFDASISRRIYSLASPGEVLCKVSITG